MENTTLAQMPQLQFNFTVDDHKFLGIALANKYTKIFNVVKTFDVWFVLRATCD